MVLGGFREPPVTVFNVLEGSREPPFSFWTLNNWPTVKREKGRESRNWPTVKRECFWALGSPETGTSVSVINLACLPGVYNLVYIAQHASPGVYNLVYIPPI